jgi:hypothetical protein
MRAFSSYSHRDDFHVELDKHMALLIRQKVADLWSDDCIRLDKVVNQGLMPLQ